MGAQTDLQREFEAAQTQLLQLQAVAIALKDKVEALAQKSAQVAPAHEPIAQPSSRVVGSLWVNYVHQS